MNITRKIRILAFILWYLNLAIFHNIKHMTLLFSLLFRGVWFNSADWLGQCKKKKICVMFWTHVLLHNQVSRQNISLEWSSSIMIILLINYDINISYYNLITLLYLLTNKHKTWACFRRSHATTTQTRTQPSLCFTGELVCSGLYAELSPLRV